MSMASTDKTVRFELLVLILTHISKLGKHQVKTVITTVSSANSILLNPQLKAL